mgnify:CR=1 FL=1
MPGGRKSLKDQRGLLRPASVASDAGRVGLPPSSRIAAYRYGAKAQHEQDVAYDGERDAEEHRTGSP